MPEVTTFNTSSRYAYTSHYKQHGLSRLDTVTLNFHGTLDLSKWKCQANKLHHLAIGKLCPYVMLNLHLYISHNHVIIN